MSPNELPCPAETDHKRRKSAASTNFSDQSSRRAWEKMISETGGGGFMITLGFRVHLDRARAIETADHFLRRINRRLFGKRYRQNEQSLRGMVVLEQKRHSSRAHDSPHFHFVVLGESVGGTLYDETQIQAVIEHEASRLLYPTLDQHRPFGPPISGADFVDLTQIESSDGLANYLTKECVVFGGACDALNIGFFGVDGITGIGVPN